MTDSFGYIYNSNEYNFNNNNVKSNRIDRESKVKVDIYVCWDTYTNERVVIEMTSTGETSNHLSICGCDLKYICTY